MVPFTQGLDCHPDSVELLHDRVCDPVRAVLCLFPAVFKGCSPGLSAPQFPVLPVVFRAAAVVGARLSMAGGSCGEDDQAIVINTQLPWACLSLFAHIGMAGNDKANTPLGQ